MSYINSYNAGPVTALSASSGITTTEAQVGSEINCTGYNKILIYVKGLANIANTKNIIVGLGIKFSTGGDIYQAISSLNPLSLQSIGSNYFNYISGYTASDPSSGATPTSITFGNHTGGATIINGAIEFQLDGVTFINVYARHDDTGTINFKFDYVLFNN